MGHMTEEIPIVLGGHSFIQQLGNERKPSASEQIEIVEACLNNGITWFDTTYLPERVALGRALDTLGRRKEATIIAWNFFVDFKDDEPHGKAEPFQNYHIEQMRDELQVDFIDCLVIHSMEDSVQDRKQYELAREWLDAGHVGRLGTWKPEAAHKSSFEKERYSFMVSPFNIANRDTLPGFKMGRELAWENIACSPFVRGFMLDDLVLRAMKDQANDDRESSARSRIADLMLRFSLFQDGVDRLIVSMRKPGWVQENINSFRKGRLSRDELRYLEI